MKIKKIEVSNYRVLKSVTVDLEEEVTIVVGRNNSGKTSLTEIFQTFFASDKSKFKFDDLSLNAHQELEDAYKVYLEYLHAISKNESEEIIFSKEENFKKTVPAIIANIFIEYSDKDNLAPISEFIMDLDINRKDILISCEYSITDPINHFSTFDKNREAYEDNIINYFRKNTEAFEKKFFVIDSKNLSSKQKIDKFSDIQKVILPRFIKAQTPLDDQSDDNSKKLSKSFENFYKYNKEASKNAAILEEDLSVTANRLDESYKTFFLPFFTDLQRFGVNTGVNKKEMELEIKSQFEVAKVLRNNANLFYRHDEQLLPESYNGLGYSRLIFTLLSILNYFEEQINLNTPPSISLLFIEEPEAHLHPQMQQTFIRNIREFIQEKKWNVQIIITTHSSYVVADCGFQSIRYFQKNERQVVVKNLSEFLKDPKNTVTLEFLQQYMTTYNCDMFFADKVIMIEGVVERLLLSEFISKVATELKKQYISIIEIGGAYAHNFRNLLDFLGVKTLIITDIDSVDPSDKRKACPVNEKENIVTSNQTLVQWLPKEKEIKNLISMKDAKKIDGKIRVAYQIPEKPKEKTGRSFEEAFILKNASVLCKNKKDISTKDLFFSPDGKKPLSKEDIVIKSYEIADSIPKKTDFAFDILLLDTWDVPRYIAEGLQWLQK